MNFSKKRLLVFATVLATLVCVHCGQKEGPLNPYVDTSPPQYVIALSANPTLIEPGGQAVVVALLQDRESNPVAGQEIKFETKLGAIDASAVTDQSGMAMAIFTASSGSGIAEITARNEHATAQTIAVLVGRGALSVSPTSILADGSSTAAISVNLVDADGSPIPAAIVTFSASRGSIKDASAKTDASGYAHATLVSEASRVDISAIVSANIAYDSISRTESGLVTMRGVSISVSADPTQIPADGISTAGITAQVKETTSGIPVAGAAVGFRSSLGVIGASATTNQSGFALASLMSSTTPGIASVKALYGGVSDSTQVIFGSLKLNLVAAYPKMVADGVSSQSVVATLLTEANNPVAGANIDFSSSEGMITKGAKTNGRGVVAAMLTSASHAASARVIASFKGVCKDTVQIGFENPAVTLRALPMSIKVKPANTSSIVAHVSFGDGTPVPDSTVVRFETSQGSLTPFAYVASGIATASLKPNGVADDAVIVRATCGSTSRTTQVIFTPDVPADLIVHAVPDTIAGGGASFATIAAEVADAYGNHVEDGTLVTFSVIAGHGLVSPTALTAGGIAVSRFTPTGGGVARVRASCEQVSADAGIVVLSQMPGAVIANPDTAWISVRDTQDRDQAVITAHVYDAYMNPVNEGTDVTFNIDYGPGGGEFIDDPGYGYGPVVKETSGGMASVTVNSGTLPGTLLMRISAGAQIATAAKIGIASGPPDSIFITTGQVVVGPDCIYTLAVGAMVRDRYNNPVENGTAVYFTLDRPDVAVIDPEAVTGGGYPCPEFSGSPDKGVTRACLRFPTSSMTEPVTIIARCGGLESSFPTGLPIVVPVNIGVGAVPGTVTGATGGDVTILVAVNDNCALPIGGATIAFSVEGSGSLSNSFAVTDANGSCTTVLTVPPGTEPGKITLKVNVFMTAVSQSVEILVL